MSVYFLPSRDWKDQAGSCVRPNAQASSRSGFQEQVSILNKYPLVQPSDQLIFFFSDNYFKSTVVEGLSHKFVAGSARVYDSDPPLSTRMRHSG